MTCSTHRRPPTTTVATKRPSLAISSVGHFRRAALGHFWQASRTGSSKPIPVHPTLAAMLAESRLSSWSAMMGRQPEPDDLLLPLPLPLDDAARRTTWKPRSGCTRVISPERVVLDPGRH